eukprot:78764-Pyramimonas_sp.AAC.1
MRPIEHDCLERLSFQTRPSKFGFQFQPRRRCNYGNLPWFTVSAPPRNSLPIASSNGAVIGCSRDAFGSERCTATPVVSDVTMS